VEATIKHQANQPQELRSLVDQQQSPGASPTAAMGATMAAGSARQAMTDACNCGPGQMVIMNNNNTMIHTQTMYRRNSLSGNNRQPEPFNPLAYGCWICGR